MNGALYVGKTGMDAISQQMNEIANNISNSQTTGFKASRVSFATLMTQNVRDASTVDGGTPTGLQLGTGVKVSGTQKDFSVGSPVSTERELDVMVNGDGFIPITKSNGEIFYTRSGNFTLDENGMIVTQNNFAVGSGFIVPEDATSVKIDASGDVGVLLAGENEFQNIGQIELVRFINPEGLRSMGDNMYQPTESSGDAMFGIAGEFGFGEFMQGYVEGSNVNMGEQLVQMIETQNSYEMVSKVISKTGEMMSNATQQIG